MKRIAISGHGMMGRMHIKALRSIGYDPVAIISRDKDRAESAAKEERIEYAVTDFEDLVKLNIDVLHICTPPSEHYRDAKKALLSGMHTIVEKPFLFDVEKGEELIKIANEKELVNAICFNIRYHDAALSARDLISSGELGELYLINGSYMQEFHALPAPYSWRYKDKFLATSEIGSHYIDLIRYLSGKEILSLSAFYKTYPEIRVVNSAMQYKEGDAEGERIKVESENVAFISFLLSGKTSANVVLSEITHGRKNYLDITLTGEKGAIWFNTEDLAHLKIGKKGEDVKERTFAFSDGFLGSISSMLSDIYKDIELGKASENRRYADFSDGLINAKVCNAIYNSAHNSSRWEDVK